MNEQEIILEQYKLYVEMADRVSSRRAETNKFYISILSGILAVLAVVIEKNLLSNYLAPVLFAISLLGTTLNIL